MDYSHGYDSRHMYRCCWKFSQKCFDDSHENLLSLFKNPKLRLDKLAIQCSNRKKKEIKKLFERSNQKIRVRQLNIDEKFLQRPTILHVFDDEALKEVTVITDDEYIRILNEFDILKKLEMFTICTWRCPTDPTLLYNFPRLTIKYYNSCEEVEVSHFIKNLLQSTQLQVCFLSCLTYSVDMGLIKSYFVEPETMVPDLPNIRRYPIPATNEFYEIDFGEEEISIERKQ